MQRSGIRDGGLACFDLHFTKPNTTAAKVDSRESIKTKYQRLDTYTVNLADSDSYLQCELLLATQSEHVRQAVVERMPEVRYEILTLLSSKTPDEIDETFEKVKLASDI
jgi:flagellar basal body-associated protein FliL